MDFQTDKQKIIDFILSVILQGSGAPIAFFANVLIARALGVKEFGIYMVLLSLAYLVGGIAVFGTNRVLIREIAQVRKKAVQKHILVVGRWGILRVLLMSVLGALMLAIWLKTGLGNEHDYCLGSLFVLAILVPASAFIIIISAFLTGLGGVKLSLAVGNPIRNGLLLVGIIFLLQFGFANKVIAILIVQSLSFVLSAIIGWYWIRKYLGGPKLRKYFRNIPNKNKETSGNYKAWRKSSWHFFIGTAGTLALNRLDIIVVNALSDTTTAGVYGAAVRIGQLAAVVALTGSAWLQPKVAYNARHNKKDALILCLKQGGWLISGGTLLVAIIIFVLADYIVSWLGPGFGVVAEPLRWITLGYTLWAIVIPFYVFLLMSGGEALIARIIWIQVVANLGLLVILVPVYGVLGATWAWVGGVTITSVLIGWGGARQLALCH